MCLRSVFWQREEIPGEIYEICLDASYHYREQVGILISSIRRVENVATELYGLILYGGPKGLISWLYEHKAVDKL